MKKKILSIALVLCMLLTVMPTTPIAATTAGTSDGPVYKYDEITCALTVDGTGTVTRDDVEAAIEHGRHIITLTIGKNVTKIDRQAFANRGLDTVIILGKTTIEENAFRENTSLKSIYLYDCEYINRDAFDMCGTSYTVYYYTTNQAAANFAEEVQVGTINNVPLNGSCGKTDSDNVTWKLSSDGTMIISGTGAMADYLVAEFDGSVEDYRPWKALVGMIKKSVIADGVTKVGNYAFQGCDNLRSVAILGSVEKIGALAFANCANLISVTVFGSIDYLDTAFAFDYKLTSVYFCGDIYGISTRAFDGLRSLTVYSCAESNAEAMLKADGYTYFTYISNRAKGFAITDGVWDTDYTYDLVNGVLTVLTPTPLTIANVDPTTATSHRIVVKKDVDANITLAGVNIDLSQTGEIDSSSLLPVSSGLTAFLIEDDSTGDVTITLAGGKTNTLKSGVSCAGIQKNGVSTAANTVGTLTVQGTGKLYATGGTQAAGIGGGDLGTGSHITIKNGYVTATGGSNAAGIGGGSYGNAADITIENGTVIANGGKWGAGIGSGGSSTDSITTSSNIVISGGNVTAKGGDYGAGIGGGTKSTGSNITISGGKVKATGQESAAGIGGGSKGAGSHITIKNGDVTATGGKDGAGIGGGALGDATDITIENGTVIATGGLRGSGIGTGGSNNNNPKTASNIVISGGNVTAKGGYCGAGIGGGTYGIGTNITVSGGIVSATGGAYGAGIGGGNAENGSNITVSGGTVTATGGTRGAGIGGGDKENGSNITISGGSVKVTAGTGGNAIGGGAEKSAVTPTDGKEHDVYLSTISNPNGNAVIVDGKLWTPVNHTAADPTDTNLYAYSTTKNAKAYAVSFNDGTSTTTYRVVGKLGDNAPATPTAPTGYTAFDGWYTAATGGTKFDFNTAITADITLYARFTPNTYTVSYNAGANGTGTVTAGSKTHGVDFTLSSDIFTRKGYTQTGWATTDGGEKVYELGGKYTDNVAVTLYPVWEVNQYTITVEQKNGEADITITQDYGTTVTAPTLTRDGYAFDGWNKTFPTTMPAEHVIITAKWKDITAPTGEIKLGTNRWNKFLNSITFGLFFKDTQEVTITATDNSDEDVTIEYLLSDKELSSDKLEKATFTAYTGKFTVEPNNEYVIYAKLTDKAGNETYINSNGIVLDNVAPVISGIEDGKTYCAAQTVTVSDKYEVTVTVNGDPVTPDTNGQFTLPAAKGEQEIVVTDKTGNQTEMTVTVNDGHTYEWQSENGKYWKKCKFCGDETDKKDIPKIVINGADKVCVTQDYTFTFTLPEGVTDPKAAYYPSETDYPLTATENGGVYTATVSHTEYGANSTVTSFFVKVFAKTADGYELFVEKKVSFQQEHIGGTADCMHKAKCEVCGDEYGEVNADNHTLKHIDAKAATVEAEGNIEYWHCEDCGKYFSDKDGKNEITLDDTVIAKLTKNDDAPPATEDNTQVALLIALFVVSAVALTGTVVLSRKRKYFAK